MRNSRLHAEGMELEFVPIRLHDAETADDLGLVELLNGWELGPGDLFWADDGRLVEVVDLVPFPPDSAIGALVKVAPAPR